MDYEIRVIGLDPGAEESWWCFLRRMGDGMAHVGHGSWAHDGRLAVPQPLVACLARKSAADRTILGVELPAPQAKGIAVAVQAGMLAGRLGQYCDEIVWLHPAEIKLAVTGNGRATKRQVQEMVSRLLGLERLLRPQHASDAAAVAIAAWKRKQDTMKDLGIE